MSQLNLSSIPMVELKAKAYDLLATIQSCQNLLQTINEEIGKRNQQPPAQENTKAPTVEVEAE